MPFNTKPKGQYAPTADEERRIQAQVLGIEVPNMSSAPAAPVLTHEEAERLREILLQHDKQNSLTPIDPNNVKVPYVYREFPKMVYHHAKSKPGIHILKQNPHGEFLDFTGPQYHTRTVNSKAELEAAYSDGFQDDPPIFDDPDEPNMPQTKNITATQIRRVPVKAAKSKDKEKVV